LCCDGVCDQLRSYPIVPQVRLLVTRSTQAHVLTCSLSLNGYIKIPARLSNLASHMSLPVLFTKSIEVSTHGCCFLLSKIVRLPLHVRFCTFFRYLAQNIPELLMKVLSCAFGQLKIETAHIYGWWLWESYEEIEYEAVLQHARGVQERLRKPKK